MRHVMFWTSIGFALLVSTVTLTSDDWPQWRGTERLAIWHATGIVEELPDELKVTWRLGKTWPVIADGLLGPLTTPE